MDDYPSSPSLDDEPISTTSNLFTRYPPNTVLHGGLYFYIKTYKRATYNPEISIAHGIRRGPIYLQSNIDIFGAAEIFATESSWNILGKGEGYMQDVEIRIMGIGGVFTIKLRGTDLYVVENNGKLFVAKTTMGDEAARFRVEIREGQMVPMTLRGRRLYDEGKQGWNSEGRGNGLWLKFVSEEEKMERRRMNPWGQWQAAYDFVWR
ncbi:hypothetical protein BDD12DRAFT_809829 [Trichophaea hybrida]|nr:hypothetical protein BDD12DRAFT_809829 [Trichophaea hybrida]